MDEEKASPSFDVEANMWDMNVTLIAFMIFKKPVFKPLHQHLMHINEQA